MNIGFLQKFRTLQDKKDKEYLEKKITDALTDIAANAVTGATNYLYLTLSADQAAGLAAGNDVRFDEKAGTIAYNTISHEMTLEKGKTYKLEAFIGIDYAIAKNVRFQWYDITNATYIGIRSIQYTVSSAGDNTTQPNAFVVVTPVSDVQVELRVQTNTGTGTLRKVNSFAYIEELK